MAAAALVTAPDPTTIPLGSPPSDHDEDGGRGEEAPSSDLSSLSSLDTSPPRSIPPPVRSSSPGPASTPSSASSSSSSANDDDDEAAAPPSPIPPTSSTPPSLASLPSRLSAAAALSSPSPPPLPATTATTMSTVAASAAAAAASEGFPSTPPHSTSMSRNLYPHRENHGIISGFLFNRRKSNSSSNSNSDVNKSNISGNEAGSDSSSSNNSNKANILSSPPSPLAQRSIDFGQLQGRAPGVDLSSSMQAMRASDEDDEDEEDARAVSGFLTRLTTANTAAPATPSPAPSASKTADPQLPPPPLIALATEEDEVAAPAAAPLKPDLDDHARADPIDQPLDATTSAYNDDFLAPFLPNAPAHATTTATATFAPPPLSLSASASTSTWWSSLPSSSTFGHRSSASTGLTGSMSSLASSAAGGQSCEPLALSLSMLGKDGGPKKGVVGAGEEAKLQGPAEVDRSLAASVSGGDSSHEDAPPPSPSAGPQQPTKDEEPAADTPSNSDNEDDGNVDAPPSPQRLIVHATAGDSIKAATGTGAVMINTTTTTTNSPACSRPMGQVDGPGDVVVDRHPKPPTTSAPLPSPSPLPDGLNIPQLIAEAVRTVLADLTVERSEEEEKRKRDAKQLLALLREEMVSTAEEAVARGEGGRKKGAEDEGVKEGKIAAPVSATHHHQVDARAMLDLLDERAERVRTTRLLTLVILTLLVALGINGTMTWRLQQQYQHGTPGHAGFYGLDEGTSHAAWRPQQQHQKVRPYHHLDEAPGDPVSFGPPGGGGGSSSGTSGSTWTSRMRLGG